MADERRIPFQEVLGDIADGVIFADPDGTIRLWNTGAAEIFGFAEREAIGANLDLIIPERLRAAHWRGYNAAIERGATVGGRRARVTKGTHKDPDRPLYVEMTFAIVTDADGSVAGSVAVARDITEQHLKAREDRKRQYARDAAADSVESERGA